MRQQETRQQPLQAGRITRLVGQKRDPQRVSVFVEGEFALGVHVDLVVEFGLHKGQVLSVEQQQQIIEADQVRKANRVALDYLGYRARTEQEVRRKLVRSGFGESMAEQTVARLRDLGYLDDASYARTYAEARFRNRRYGPQRLRNDLLRRGVARSVIDTTLDALFNQEDMLEAARVHAEKRWLRLATEGDPFKRRKKLSEYLLRRGFSYDTIRRVVEELERREDKE
ncbi:MAG: RecX family transcriptional regulator [Rhodothermales bacterium]